MSVEEFQKRITDLKFSVKEHIKALEKEQSDSEDAHWDWEDAVDGTDEPEVVDHENKISAIEAALDHLDNAIAELDGALDD